MNVRSTIVEMSCSNERMAGLGEILCARQDPSRFPLEAVRETALVGQGDEEKHHEMFPWHDESDGKRITIKAERIGTAGDAAANSKRCLKVGRRPLAQ
jgi:hypothetical protein